LKGIISLIFTTKYNLVKERDELNINTEQKCPINSESLSKAMIDLVVVKSVNYSIIFLDN